MKYFFLSLFITSCGVRATDNSEKATIVTADTEMPEHSVSPLSSMSNTTHTSTAVHEISENTQSFLAVHDNCKCPLQFELLENHELTHIRNGFYKSKTGHLYHKTTGVTEVNGNLVDHDYFNGHFSQEVDPLTFRPIGGSWYAVDKQNVYYYRAVSGGMRIFKMEEANVKTFKILDGHYRYAQDKYHFYQDAHIIENYNPQNAAIQRDERGKPIALSNKTGIYRLE